MIDRHKQRDLDEAMLIPNLLMPDFMSYLRGFTTLLIVILGWYSLTLEVLVRRNFGERYLSPMRVIMGLGAIGLGIFSMTLSSINVEGLAPEHLFGFGFLFAIASGIHLLNTQIRNWRGTRWHSMSFGESWFDWFIWRWDWSFYRFIEPVGALAVAYLIYLSWSPSLGGWLGLASIALLIKNNMIYSQMRSAYLDMVDAQIEAEYWQQAQEGKRKRDTAGFSIVQVPHKSKVKSKPMNVAETVQATMNNGNHAGEEKEAIVA